MRSRWLFPFIAAALLAAAIPALADWSPDPYIGGLPLSSTTNVQDQAVGVSDGAGGVILVWQDLRNGVDFDLFAQRINPAGQVLWNVTGVSVCGAVGAQTQPVIAPDGAGGAIIAWRDFRSGSSYDVYAQRLNGNGAAQWAPNGVVVSNATGNQDTPAIASDGAGGALLAWQDLRSGVTYDIYAQRIGPTGTMMWAANGLAVCVAGGSQWAPKVVVDGANGMIATWYDLRGATYDIYAQRVSAAGSAQWTADGVVICNQTGTQQYPTIVSDLTGGAVIAWEDQRSGNSDIYAQRVGPAGSVYWTGGGVVVCATTNGQLSQAMVTDGSGGAIMAWIDFRAVSNAPDIYAQRINAAGGAMWPANGLPVNYDNTGTQLGPVSAVEDGLGGVLVNWSDARGLVAYDLYAQHLNAAGGHVWNNDRLICGAVGDQYGYSLVSDGEHGAISLWSDYRSGTAKVYAQELNASGELGDCAPRIVSVRDVPNDQGGFLNVRFNASRLDVDPNGYLQYVVWRQIPNAAAQVALAHGARLDAAGGHATRAGEGTRVIQRTTDPNGIVYYWEQAGWADAVGHPAYAVVIETTSDSVAGSNPRTLIRVDADDYNNDVFYDSTPDSGYSVDNLPPGTPGQFAGQYAGGSTQLHWLPSVASDLAGYRLYRGGASFVPGPQNLVASLSDTGYVDNAGGPYVYKLTAVDSHGNESPVATAVPSGTLDVAGAPGSLFFLAAPSPNPAHAGAGLTLRFGLSRRGEARVQVFDAQGRLVRTLAAGMQEPGEHAVRWDGRDEARQPLSAGLYFVRLEAESRTAHTRVALMP